MSYWENRFAFAKWTLVENLIEDAGSYRARYRYTLQIQTPFGPVQLEKDLPPTTSCLLSGHRMVGESADRAQA